MDGEPPRRRQAQVSGAAPRRFLLGYDGSDGSKAAVAAAGRLLAGESAAVVSVWQSVAEVAPASVIGMPAEMAGDAARRLETEASERAEALAAEGAELARAAGLEADPRAVRAGASAWATIRDCAEELDAVAVVVGSRGLSGLRSALLGSVSNALVHHSSRPVLVVSEPEEDGDPQAPPSADGPPGAPLLCHDGSTGARHALEQAGAVLGGGEATVLSVWESDEPTVIPDRLAGRTELGQDLREMAQLVVAELDTDRREHAEQVASEGAEIARAAGLDAQPRARRAVSSFRDRGSTTVWQAVLEVAGEERSSLAVVGTRGRSAVSSALLGSVSSGVLHNRTGPVLVVPPPDG